MRYARTCTAAICLVLAHLGARRASGDELEIKVSECPAVVQKTLAEESKGAEVVSVTKETEEGKTTYWANVVYGGKTYGIGVLEDGTLSEIALEIDDDEIHVSNCPAAVQKTLRDETKGAKVEVVTRDLKFGAVIYETVVAVGERQYDIVVAEDGTLVEKTLVIEEDEVQLSDCPIAVQKMLRGEARGGKIGEITRLAGIVGHVYETSVVIKGKRYWVEVSERGMLISKALDEDAEP